jgi:hypothetical protein
LIPQNEARNPLKIEETRQPMRGFLIMLAERIFLSALTITFG